GLLMNKSVQEELKLDEDQVKKIGKVVEEVMAKHQGEFAGLRDLEPEQRREKMQEVTKKVSEDAQKHLTGILKPEQEKRFKQIELQLRGIEAFMDPEVQTALKLADDQKEKIKTIGDDARKEMRTMFQGGGFGDPETRKKIAAFRKETLAKAEAVLT